jgi:hypothetical protein
MQGFNELFVCDFWATVKGNAYKAPRFRFLLVRVSDRDHNQRPFSGNEAGFVVNSVAACNRRLRPAPLGESVQ